MSVNDDNEDDELTPLVQNSRFSRSCSLTVEFPVFFVLFGAALTTGVASNLLLYRTCKVDLAYNQTKCDLLLLKNKTDEAKELETEVQAKVTWLVMTLSLISGLVPGFLSLFVGAWSDRHGRRPLVIWSLVGFLITMGLTIIYTAVPTLGSWWYILCIIPSTIFGGGSTFNLGTNLLITDTTDESNRSFRLAILQGSFFLGMVSGTLLSSYVYQAIGYTYLYSVAFSTYLISFFYVLIFVKESLRSPEKPSLTTLFKVDSLKGMMDICYKIRPKYVTSLIMLLLSAYGITMIYYSGCGNIEYLFTRQRFGWLLRDYTIFSAICVMASALGVFIWMPVLQNVCGLTDGVILVLAYLSAILQSLMKALASTPWGLYAAPPFAMLEGLMIPLLKAQVAKIVPSDEVGKTFSLLSCVEAILPVFAPTLYSALYYKTLNSYPGAVFLLNVLFLSTGLILVTVAEVLYLKIRKNQLANLLENTTVQNED